MLVYPDLLLTTGDDVSYGSQMFECRDHLDKREVCEYDIL